MGGKFPLGNNFGNRKGRIKGSKNKVGVNIFKYFDDKDIAKILDILKRKAKGENVKCDLQAIKLILDILPLKKTFLSNPFLAHIKTEEDIDKASESVVSEVGDAEVSIEDGLALLNIVEKRGVTILTHDLKKIEQMKKELENKE